MSGGKSAGHKLRCGIVTADHLDSQHAFKGILRGNAGKHLDIPVEAIAAPLHIEICQDVADILYLVGALDAECLAETDEIELVPILSGGFSKGKRFVVNILKLGELLPRKKFLGKLQLFLGEF